MWPTTMAYRYLQHIAHIKISPQGSRTLFLFCLSLLEMNCSVLGAGAGASSLPSAILIITYHRDWIIESD
jgi:hypothetical protein